jgi:hypothetical protein
MVAEAKKLWLAVAMIVTNPSLADQPEKTVWALQTAWTYKRRPVPDPSS